MTVNLSSLVCCGGATFNNIAKFTADGVWTKPTNVSVIRVIAMGGGGGGGTSGVRIYDPTGGPRYFTNTYHGGGGGAGQYIDDFFEVTGDITITIGQGGQGAPAPIYADNYQNNIDGTVESYSGGMGGATILSGGLNLTAYGGGGGAGMSDDIGNGIPNPVYSNNIGCGGGPLAILTHPANSYDIISMNGANVGCGIKNPPIFALTTTAINTSYVSAALPLHPNKIYGNRFGDIPSGYWTVTLIDSGKGINGLGGGGRGATDKVIVGDDGSGANGIVKSLSSSESVTQNDIDGKDAEPNTGAGGGAGGVVEAYSTSGIGNIIHGRGGDGGSGIVIIMW